MIFNEFQKDIIGSINSNLVFSIKSFIDKYVTTQTIYKNEEYSGPGYNQYHFSINLDKGIKILHDDRKHEKVKEFIYIWDLLTRNELIYTYETGPEEIKNNIYSLFTKDDDGFKHDTNLFHLTGFYLNKEIKPYPALSEFINNNYLTANEMNLSLERNSRKQSEFWTRTIAIISIIVNILLVLFQYYSVKR